MSRSLFQPCITIGDDGTIDIDWSDSYVNTVYEPDVLLYEEPPGHPHSALLDRLVSEDQPSPAVALRRLADYMESQ